MYTVIKTSQWRMLKHGTCILKCDDSESSKHLQWNMTELVEGGLPVPACLHPHHQQMCNNSNHQGTAHTGNRTMMEMVLNWGDLQQFGLAIKQYIAGTRYKSWLDYWFLSRGFPWHSSVYMKWQYTFKQAITNSQSLTSKPFMNICLCCNSVVYSVHSWHSIIKIESHWPLLQVRQSDSSSMPRPDMTGSFPIAGNSYKDFCLSQMQRSHFCY